jgi:nucleotide-binding universal stress UspA family protein
MAFLAGTVSARLFAAGRLPLVALRVVHPGLLGQPERLLLPVIGRAGAARDALPLLRLFGAELGRLHVQWVHSLSRIRFRMLGVAAAEHLLEEARVAAGRFEDEIRAELDLAGCTFDAGAVVTDDWPKEILIAAGRQQSGIVCLPAPGRDIPGRIFFGTAVEQVLRSAPCDVAVYRGLE